MQKKKKKKKCLEEPATWWSQHATFDKMVAAVGSALTAECESVGQQREGSGHYPLFVIPKTNLVSYNGTYMWIYCIRMVTDKL